MEANLKQSFTPKIVVEKLEKFAGNDLEDLCEATEKTLQNEGQGFSVGFNWLNAPPREKLESYWKGLMLVPEREIYIGRIDGLIASSIQLVKPPRSNQAQSFAANAREHFVAPWARGHGLAKMLLKAVEDEAMQLQYKILKLEVVTSQEAAVTLYESSGYKKWGTLDKYAFVNGSYVSGNFYYKDLI